MLAKRIVAALDIRDGKVVKGVNFKNITEIGEPVKHAVEYEKQGIDEIVFLDIDASSERRGIMKNVVKEIAKVLSIPFTVGGGLSAVSEMIEMVKAGADKVFVNSAAVRNPKLISDAVSVIGSANVCLALDAKYVNGVYEVYINGGKTPTGIKADEWANEVETLGAGEILLTSMETDGVRDGFDLTLNKLISETVSIPVIASGGAGKKEDFLEVFRETEVSAALAASVFHYGNIKINSLKKYLKTNGVNTRYE